MLCNFVSLASKVWVLMLIFGSHWNCHGQVQSIPALGHHVSLFRVKSERGVMSRPIVLVEEVLRGLTKSAVVPCKDEQLIWVSTLMERKKRPGAPVRLMYAFSLRTTRVDRKPGSVQSRTRRN